jgi:FKBP-type peptidyl-prolyl cis-trans isomerase SlyD
MTRPRLAYAAWMGLLLGAAPLAQSAEEGVAPPGVATEVEPPLEGQEVRAGAVVHLEFTLWDDAGALLDTTRGRTPLVFTHGQGEVIAGLERALLGMKVGETKRVTVAPDDAYGPVDPSATTEVPVERVPAEARKVGVQLRGQTRSGREMPVRVREIRDGTAILDLNHPLAGRTLVFEVRVILVEPP